MRKIERTTIDSVDLLDPVEVLLYI